MAMATANSILLHHNCCLSGLARKNVPEQQKLLRPIRAEYTVAAGHSMPAKSIFTPGALPAFKFAFAPNRRYAQKGECEELISEGWAFEYELDATNCLQMNLDKSPHVYNARLCFEYDYLSKLLLRSGIVCTLA
jgi:hypothetical protein